MAADQNALLEVCNLSIELHTERGTSLVVDSVNLTVRPREVVGLVGESGSGKTLTALAIMNLLPKAASLASGQILFESRDLSQYSEAEMQRVRGSKIGLVFQSSKTALNPLMRVGQQIARVFKLRQGLRKSESLRKAEEILRQVGIPHAERRVNSYPHQFSGGMAQRVLIAMMIASRPQLLIADEPTTGLDVTTEAQIFDLLLEARQSLGSAMLLITHDLGLIAANCERVGVMHGGHIVEFGPVRQIFHNPHHPYTQGLLSSIPRPDRATLPESTLIGAAIDPMRLPTHGCRFISRCPVRMEICTQPVPLEKVGPDHTAFCHLYGPDNE